MNYFDDPKYFGTEIVFGGLGKFHFLFADTHVLPDTKLGCRDSNPQSPGFIPRHIVRTSALVTRDGAIPVVVWTVSL